jgi:secreted trypsin-like serine protease
VPVARLARLPAVGLASTFRPNQLLDVVGYGASQTRPLVFGTAQVATTKLDSAGVIGTEFLKLQAAPGACMGDSGGPNLVHGGDVMLGISSFSAANPNCNGNSYSERLDTAAAHQFLSSFLP